MTEQTPQDEAREEENKRPEPRDAAYWAQYAEKLKELVKAAKRYATGATEGLRETLGPELADVDWRKLDPRQYDPRTIVRQALLEDDEAPAASSASIPDRRDELVSVRLAPGERAPFDGEST